MVGSDQQYQLCHVCPDVPSEDQEGQHQRSQGRPAADLPDHLLPLGRRQVPCRPDVADQDLPCRQTDARLERQCIVRRLLN
jgi:hypothetical protein